MRLGSLFLFLFLGVFCSSVYAQNTFIKRFDAGSSSVAGGPLIQTSDGGCVAAFATGVDQFHSFPGIIKFDSKGNLLWTKSFGDGIVGHVFALASSGNNFFVTGYTNDISGIRSFVMKCDSLGNTLWTSTLIDEVDSTAGGIASTDDGGCIAAGDVISQIDFSEVVYAMRLGNNGKVQWARHISSDQLNAAPSLIESVTRLDSANYILCGYDPFGISGINIIKLHSSGSVGWNRIASGPFLGASATATSDGGFAVCGEAFDEKTFATNVYAAKFDSAGAIKWGEQIDVFEDEIGSSITETINGDLLIAGTRSTTDSIVIFSTDSALIIRLSKDGELRTAKLLAATKENSVTTGVIHSRDGGYIFAGVIGEDLTNGPFGLLLGKLDESGDGCSLENQLASVRPSDSVFDVQFSVSADLTVVPLDLKTVSTITLLETDICSALSVTPLQSGGENISLFPNPLPESHPLTISIEGSLTAGIYDLSIRDLLGNIIKQEKIDLSGSKKDVLLDMPECTAGVYVVELKDNKGNLRKQKLIKQ